MPANSGTMIGLILARTSMDGEGSLGELVKLTLLIGSAESGRRGHAGVIPCGNRNT